jgi:hypothetical protein
MFEKRFDLSFYKRQAQFLYSISFSAGESMPGSAGVETKNEFFSIERWVGDQSLLLFLSREKKKIAEVHNCR